MKYSPALVSFIDILGFSQLVKRSPPQKIYDLIKKIRKYAARNDALVGSTSLSDAVVRAWNVEECWFGSFACELTEIALLQLSCIGDGILIRGGLSGGAVYYEKTEDIMFGPAVIDAY